jgi:hypothetical protein
MQDALEAQEWPQVYRERNEIPEHRFKDMIDHGALRGYPETCALAKK